MGRAGQCSDGLSLASCMYSAATADLAQEEKKHNLLVFFRAHVVVVVVCMVDPAFFLAEPERAWV